MCQGREFSVAEARGQAPRGSGQAWANLGGTLPVLDFKVGWYISDHTEPGHSTILVPGSYRWSPEQRATFEDWLDPADIVAVKVPAGTVLRQSFIASVSS